MKWIAQVGHVARKDVRQVGWMLLLYIVTIVITTSGIVSGKAFGPYSTAPNNEIMGMPDSFVVVMPALLALIGIVSAAVLVQLDSPTRPNAFWTTRPLMASAVLTSKVILTTVVMVGLAVLGAAIALATIDTGAATMTRLLLSTAVSAGEWALVALVLGALTGDLRGFVGGLTATVLALVLMLWTVAEFALSISVPASVALTVVSISSACWFVARLFRRHERRPGTWVAGFVIAAALMLSSLLVPQPMRDVPVLSDGIPLQMKTAVANEAVAQARYPITVRIAQASDSERLDFTADSLIWKRASGKPSVNFGAFSTVVVGGALPWLGHAVRWINIDATSLEWPSVLLTDPPEKSRDTVSRVNAVSLAGVVTVSRSHIVASLPLKRDASVVTDGRRIRLYGGEEHNGEGARVRIQLTTVRRPWRTEEPQQKLGERDNLQFALVNDALGEAMMLEAPADGSGSSGAVVLPQITMETRFDAFSTVTQYSPKSGVARDDSWYKGARLVVIEWSVVGRYRTSAEARVE